MKASYQLRLVVFISYFITIISFEHHEILTPQNNWERPFMIMILADPQIGWNKDDYHSEELFKVASKHVKRLQPEFLVILGDLIQKAGDEEENEISKSILDDMSIPYYVVSGNHDVKTVPTMKLLNQFKDWWDIPHNWYSFEYYSTLFLMMESDILRARDLLRDGEESSDEDEEIELLAEQQLQWLDSTLEEAFYSGKYNHVIPIFHHPFSVKSLSENDDRRNMPKVIRTELLSILEQWNFSFSDAKKSWITHVFSGHYHGNARISDINGVDFITYASTGVILGGRDESGLTIVKIDEDEIEENYYGYNDVPSTRAKLETRDARFKVVNPGRNDVLLVGNKYDIEWLSTSNSQYVQIQLVYRNIGNRSSESKHTIAENVHNNGQFQWTITRTMNIFDDTSIQDLEFKILISSIWDSYVRGVSEGWFKLAD